MPKITFAEILRMVASYYMVSVSDLKSHKRARVVTRPRQIACYLGREITDLSYPQMGRALGGRDHSTIIHSCDVIENLMSRDKRFAAEVERIRLVVTSNVAANDNEVDESQQEDVTQARALFEERERLAKEKLAEVAARVAAHFAKKDEEKRKKAIDSLDEMDAISMRVAEYYSRPLEERLAE